MTAHPPKNDERLDPVPDATRTGAPVVFLGGRRVLPEQAVVSIFDRGFTQGDGLFETMLATAGVIFGEEAHLSRLEHSADALGLPLPRRESLHAELHAALSALGLSPAEEGVVRLQVTSGAPGAAPTRVVTARHLTDHERHRRHGLELFTVGPGRAPAGGAGGHKTSSWSVSAAARRTHPEGAAPTFEGLFVTGDGEVVEGTTTAIGILRAGALIFPPLDGRILDSVTRRRVVAGADQIGLRVEVGRIFRQDLADAEGVIALNALLPVAVCTSLDGEPLGRRAEQARHDVAPIDTRAVADAMCHYLMRR